MPRTASAETALRLKILGSAATAAPTLTRYVMSLITHLLFAARVRPELVLGPTRHHCTRYTSLVTWSANTRRPAQTLVNHQSTVTRLGQHCTDAVPVTPYVGTLCFLFGNSEQKTCAGILGSDALDVSGPAFGNPRQSDRFRHLSTLGSTSHQAMGWRGSCHEWADSGHSLQPRTSNAATLKADSHLSLTRVYSLHCRMTAPSRGCVKSRFGRVAREQCPAAEV